MLPSIDFSAPFHDRKFCQLPEGLRRMVAARLTAMQRIAHADCVGREIKAIAANRQQERGWKRGTLTNLWYAFARSGGDWKVLVDRAMAGPRWWAKADALPFAFLEYLAGERCMHQRGKFNSAYDALDRQLKQWRRGEAAAIPGYDRPPENAPFREHPEGWSRRNLRRAVQTHARDFARKLIQIGPKAASNLAPKILGSRCGIEPGEFYLPDDSWNDFRVLFRGQGSRLLSLHFLDLASGCNVLRGYKPTFEDERGVEQRLKEREMVFLLAALLSTIGYRKKGTTFICEKATATVRASEAELLLQMTGGRVHVQTGPAGGGPGILGLCTGRGGGNPRWKAPLESWFNLLRNRTDHMVEYPGQIGSLARLNGPEGLAKLEATDEAIFRAMQVLPKEKADLVRFNLLQHWDAIAALEATTEVINTRRDHELNEWRKCGHYVPAFRLAPHLPLMPHTRISQLAPEAQAQLAAMLQAQPELTGEIALSPREVFDAGAGRLTKFTPPQTALLLGGVEGREQTVRNGVLAVECAEVDADEPLQFGPLLRDCNGGEEPLQNGGKHLVRVNPFAPGMAFVYDAKGGFLGVAESWGRSQRNDEAGLRRAFGVKNKALAPQIAHARRLAAPITQRAAEIVAANAEAFAPTSKEVRATERKLDRAARANTTDFTILAEADEPAKESSTLIDDMNKL